MTRFKMSRITVDQFAILADNLPDQISMNMSYRFKYAENGRKVAVEIIFTFLNKTVKIMTLQLTCEFEINEEDYKTFITNNVVTIPKDLLEYFVVHTIGTARGIMHCKTEGTPFNGIIIPPINVSGTVKNDMVIQP